MLLFIEILLLVIAFSRGWVLGALISFTFLFSAQIFMVEMDIHSKLLSSAIEIVFMLSLITMIAFPRKKKEILCDSCHKNIGNEEFICPHCSAKLTELSQKETIEGDKNKLESLLKNKNDFERIKSILKEQFYPLKYTIESINTPNSYMLKSDKYKNSYIHAKLEGHKLSVESFKTLKPNIEIDEEGLIKTKLSKTEEKSISNKIENSEIKKEENPKKSKLEISSKTYKIGSFIYMSILILGLFIPQTFVPSHGYKILSYVLIWSFAIYLALVTGPHLKEYSIKKNLLGKNMRTEVFSLLYIAVFAYLNAFIFFKTIPLVTQYLPTKERSTRYDINYAQKPNDRAVLACSYALKLQSSSFYGKLCVSKDFYFSDKKHSSIKVFGKKNYFGFYIKGYKSDI